MFDILRHVKALTIHINLNLEHNEFNFAGSINPMLCIFVLYIHYIFLCIDFKIQKVMFPSTGSLTL